MNELIKIANDLYAEKKWEEARKAYMNIIDSHIYDVPLGVLKNLIVVQRTLKHFDSCEKTLGFGFEKFPNNFTLLVEKAALENNRKKWNLAIEYWEKVKLQSGKFSVLNYQRYSIALHEYCKSNSKNINDKINKKTCIKLRDLISEAFSIYGEDNKILKSILDSIGTE